MNGMRGPFLLITVAALLAGCEGADSVTSASGSQSATTSVTSTPAYERADATPLDQGKASVRIGENGPTFPACAARGTSRRVLGAGDYLSVRAAPFEAAQEMARIPAGGTFYVCSRSLDQRWLGVVFDDAGTAAPGCGLIAPVPRRQDYDGPCRSGWLPAGLVKQGAI